MCITNKSLHIYAYLFPHLFQSELKFINNQIKHCHLSFHICNETNDWVLQSLRQMKNI